MCMHISYEITFFFLLVGHNNKERRGRSRARGPSKQQQQSHHSLKYMTYITKSYIFVNNRNIEIIMCSIIQVKTTLLYFLYIANVSVDILKCIPYITKIIHSHQQPKYLNCC